MVHLSSYCWEYNRRNEAVFCLSKSFPIQIEGVRYKMQFLRRSHVIRCQLIGIYSRCSSIKAGSMPLGFPQHVKRRSWYATQFQSCYFLFGSPRVALYRESSERALLIVRYQSKISQTNVDQPATISVRSLLNVNSIGKGRKQGREVQRLIELAKPEWRKLGGILLVCWSTMLLLLIIVWIPTRTIQISVINNFIAKVDDKGNAALILAMPCKW